jgi:ketosteroid isomerase-like protein
MTSTGRDRPTLMTNEQQVRRLVERYVAAVRQKDIDGIVRDHAEHIVMYDVPPPYVGNRGIDEFRASWPQFFDYLDAGAVFELVELDVVAGEDVAFAYGLLKCGKPADFDAKPDLRLRLTLGLRRVGGGWVVTHEHHSFPAE